MFLIKTVAPNEESAKELAKKIVDAVETARVEIKQIKSVYKWKGKLNTTTEYEITVLTDKMSEIIEIIKENSVYRELLLYSYRVF